MKSPSEGPHGRTEEKSTLMPASLGLFCKWNERVHLCQGKYRASIFFAQFRDPFQKPALGSGSAMEPSKRAGANHPPFAFCTAGSSVKLPEWP